MSVIKKQAYFQSSTGKNSIRCLIWQREQTPYKGIFQIAHGVSEHIGRYERLASELAELGYIVCGNDHLGHGLSVQSADDFGFFDDEDGDLRLVDDMHILTLIMKKRYPGLPVVLFGHSLGSFCARVYAASFPSELSGLILCGSGEVPSSAVLLEAPVRLLCERLGARADVPTHLFDKLSCLGIKNKNTDKDWLSKNEQNVRQYLDDELCGFELKLGAVRDIISLVNTACSTEWAANVPVGLPILIISGAKDPIGLGGRGVIMLADNLEDVGHAPRVIMYPGLRHEILNESDNDKVYDDIKDWLGEVVG